jgi:hypothetical protein
MSEWLSTGKYSACTTENSLPEQGSASNVNPPSLHLLFGPDFEPAQLNKFAMKPQTEYCALRRGVNVRIDRI